MTSSGRLLTYVAIGVILGGVAASGNAFLIQAAIGVAISAIMALSWDILSRTGQVSLGHSAFFGIGAYGSGLLTPYFGTVLGWTAGILLCAVAAILLGVVTLRLRQLYFTIATLSFGLSMQVAILMTPGLTGGSTTSGPPDRQPCRNGIARIDGARTRESAPDRCAHQNPSGRPQCRSLVRCRSTARPWRAGRPYR